MIIINIIYLITCNAPMPAFPNVHIDGAAAKALANAFLHHRACQCSLNKKKLMQPKHYPCFPT